MPRPLRLGLAVWFVLVRHNPVRPGISVLDAQDIGDLAHALCLGELRGRSLHVLLERLVRQEDDGAGVGHSES